MNNLTHEQLEQAQTKLITRIHQARCDLDYLTRELSRLVIGYALGTVSLDEVKAVRQQIFESNQVLEETPAALAILKESIEQVRSQEAQRQRKKEAEQTLSDYFAARQVIIDNPGLAEKQFSGRLRGLASVADRDVSAGRMSKYQVSFDHESRSLLSAANEYNSRNHSEPFNFNVLIPE